MKIFRNRFRAAKPFLASLLIAFAAAVFGAAPRETTPDEVRQLFERNSPEHPRLFLRDFGILEQARQTPSGAALSGRILHEAGKMLEYPVVERTLIGTQMLHVSRTVLYRVNTLTLACRLSGERRYADRAIREMRNAAAFPDWNPQHFLDVAEMTLALSFGYDWLYDLLSSDDRKAIEEAIVAKGLLPSWENRSGNWWIRGASNWNQVCHAGMAAGSLAVFEKNPELAARTVARAVNNLPIALRASYFPRGAYPEGPMYWSYGTDFTAVLLAVLTSSLGTEFDLSRAPGFAETGEYMLAVRAPSGLAFNYADSVGDIGTGFAQVFLAGHFDRPDWIPPRMQEDLLSAGAYRREDVSKEGNRMLPLAMIFFRDYRRPVRETPRTYFSGNEAAVPVAMLRTGWEPEAGYLGVKAGSPSWPHGHMDAGSFVYEADGVRWAQEIGWNNYDNFLSRGMKLWNTEQDSDRWKIFCIGPFSHNILLIDGQLQAAKHKAHILECTENSVVVELSDLYEGRADRVTRSFRLNPDRSVDITDRVAGVRPGSVLRRQMLTGAAATVEQSELLLTENGKQLRLSVDSPVPGTWKITETKELEAEWDTPNRGRRIVAYEQAVPADGRLISTVHLVPGSTQEIPAGVISPGSAEKWAATHELPEFALEGEFTFECKVRPVRSRAPEKVWKNGGVAVCRDERNYFLFSFCEAPAASGGRRFLELKQQKDGRWGAADGIAPGEHRSDFRWEYGTDYRMSIAVSGTAVTGTLRTMDGNEAAKITVPRTPGEAVTSGRAALRVSGLQIYFSEPERSR